MERLPEERLASPASMHSAMREHGMGSLIGAIGRPGFEQELACELTQMFDSEFVHICQIPDRQPSIRNSIASDGSGRACEQSEKYLAHQIWRFDPSMQQGIAPGVGQPVVSHLNIRQPETRELKQFYDAAAIGERIVVYGPTSVGHLGLSVVRSAARGEFSPEMRERIAVVGNLAFPLLVRHCALLEERDIFSRSLSSLDLIQACLETRARDFPKREAQVAARILYGMTCEGIGLDLGIAYETVITYKKRIFQRLGIASFRELLTWYLGIIPGAAMVLSNSRSFH